MCRKGGGGMFQIIRGEQLLRGETYGPWEDTPTEENPSRWSYIIGCSKRYEKI